MKEKEMSTIFKFRSNLSGTNQMQDGVGIVHYESRLEIPEMLLQNLSNIFSSWCSNKSFRSILQAPGKLRNEGCYIQLETCPLQCQTFPRRKEKSYWKRLKQKMGMGGGGSEQRDKGERERTRNYLKFASLSPSSLSVTWVITSESNQKTLSSPKVLLSLSVSIVYSNNLNFKA